MKTVTKTLNEMIKQTKMKLEVARARYDDNTNPYLDFELGAVCRELEAELGAYQNLKNILKKEGVK